MNEVITVYYLFKRNCQICNESLGYNLAELTTNVNYKDYVHKKCITPELAKPRCSICGCDIDTYLCSFCYRCLDHCSGDNSCSYGDNWKKYF
jgi:hypothetical protein